MRIWFVVARAIATWNAESYSTTLSSRSMPSRMSSIVCSISRIDCSVARSAASAADSGSRIRRTSIGSPSSSRTGADVEAARERQRPRARRDADAALAARLDRAHVVQRRQRLPQHVAAHRQLVAQLALGREHHLRRATARDQVQQLVGDLLRQPLAPRGPRAGQPRALGRGGGLGPRVGRV